MIKFISMLISKVKGQNFYVDTNVTFSDILVICLQRTFMIFLGSLKCIRVKKQGLIFVGKSVKLVCKRKMVFGKGVTLHRNVEINALSKNGVKLGRNASIGAYSIIKCTGTLKKIGVGIEIGDNFGCGEYSFFGAAGGIKIGNNVIMGQNVRFHSENHVFSRCDIPIREQGVSNKGIVVNDDCWVGSGVVFLDGVEVGKGCVVGANTLVNKDIPEYSIAVGNPVRIIKNRIDKQ